MIMFTVLWLMFPRNHTFYFIAKTLAENPIVILILLCESCFADKHQFETIICRSCKIFGPGGNHRRSLTCQVVLARLLILCLKLVDFCTLSKTSSGQQEKLRNSHLVEILSFQQLDRIDPEIDVLQVAGAMSRVLRLGQTTVSHMCWLNL